MNKNEVNIPRFDCSKDFMRSFQNHDISQEINKTSQLIPKLWESATWDSRLFKPQPQQTENNLVSKSTLKQQNTTTEEIKEPIEKQEKFLFESFINECETFEGVIINLINEIDGNTSYTDQNRQEKKLELIRYACEELSQRKNQNAICRLFGYVNNIYESEIKIRSKADKLNCSPSAYEILLQENVKLSQNLEKERERRVKAEEDYK